MIFRWFAPGEDCPEGDAIRMEVFVAEQHVSPEEEMDGQDAVCWHVVGYEDGVPAAVGRMLYEGENVWHPGRIAVRKSFRGQGFGAQLVQQVIRKGEELGAGSLHLVAQCHAEGFYEQCGFTSLHEYCMDAGIPHVQMIYRYS